MASFAYPQAPVVYSHIEVTSQSRYVMLAAIGVQVANTANCADSCSILLYRGFSEFYRSSTVSLDHRTLVAVSISVQIRQVPSRLRLFIPSIRSTVGRVSIVLFNDCELRFFSELAERNV